MKNKRCKALMGVVAALFLILLLCYVVDPNYRQTQRRLYPAKSEVGQDFMLSSLNVTSIAQDARKLIWIGTSAGVNVYNGKDFVQFTHDSQDTTALPDDYINVVFRDKTNRMWVGTQNGLASYEGANRFRRYTLPCGGDNIVAIADAADRRGNVVVSNGRGTYEVSARGEVKPSRQKVTRQGRGIVVLDTTYAALLEHPREMIACEFVDSGGNHWVGYRNAGFQVLSHNIASYAHANCNELTRATAGKDIVCLKRVGRYILAGTTLRLYVYDMLTERIAETPYRQLFTTLGGADDAAMHELKELVDLGEGKVALLSDDELVIGHIAATTLGIDRLHVVRQQGRLGMGLKTGHILYVTTDGGVLLAYDWQKKALRRIKIIVPYYDEETQLAQLRDGGMLLFMKQMQLAVWQEQTQQLRSIRTNVEASSARNIDPAFVMQDSRGCVWLGTKRYGLYTLDMKHHSVVRRNIVNDVHVQGMTEDERGQLWITTLKDAICYQPTKQQVMMSSLVSSSQNGWQRQFFDNAICLSLDSCVVLGSSDGCIFLPTSSGNQLLASNKRKQGQKQVTFDHGTSLEGGLCIYSLTGKKRSGEAFVVDALRHDNAHYTFAYDENTLKFSYFYPNYSRRSALFYQVKLEGQDAQWRTPTYDNSITFENLRPGRYAFRVRLLTSLQQDPLAERVVYLEVKSAPWTCSAAWVLYVALLVGAIVYVNSLVLHLRTNQMMLRNEQRERERERYTKEMNMNFFANITHEFRNPLTLIAGPLLALKADKSLPQSVHQTLNRVAMSANRMLRLIDQMLDFNQLEADALRLQVVKADVAVLFEEWGAALEESCRVRHITLQKHCELSAKDKVWIDTDKLEKVFSNLFTNALKHTPNGGVITLSLRMKFDAEPWLIAEVMNSGSHIDPQHLNDVFKRYYQQRDVKAQHDYGWGTGIGLYYVKRLVELHHGEIEVENVKNDILEGVCFRFRLPVGAGAYAPADFAHEAKQVMQIPLETTASVDAATIEKVEVATHNIKHSPKILVVDDDEDVAQYVSSLFKSHYRVEVRYSAESALADIAQLKPDIVLSDVMMNGMSGFELCKTLKADLTYSHIPFVLITAKADMSERISGLRLGAVAYVTKPFDPLYLQALVEAQLQHVQTLRQRLGERVETGELADALSEQDRKFMDELYALMQKRAGELDLNVAAVSRDLLISQSKFTYKLKELTGDTPGVFFRKYKLNKAAQLLREGKHNVSEVALMTGFATAAHFSVAFKKQFGVSPSEY